MGTVPFVYSLVYNCIQKESLMEYCGHQPQYLYVSIWQAVIAKYDNRYIFLLHSFVSVEDFCVFFDTNVLPFDVLLKVVII